MNLGRTRFYPQSWGWWMCKAMLSPTPPFPPELCFLACSLGSLCDSFGCPHNQTVPTLGSLADLLWPAGLTPKCLICRVETCKERKFPICVSLC